MKFPGELQPWREAARVLPLGRDEKFFLRVDGGPFETETQVLGNPRDARTAFWCPTCQPAPAGSRIVPTGST